MPTPAPTEQGRPEQSRPEQIKTVSEPAVPRVAIPARRSPSSVFRLAAALLLSALLGSAIGYGIYLQFPSSIIDVRAQRRGAGLMVQWPATQTRDVDYAAYRINDGPAQLLTLPQKLAGEVEIPLSSDDTKVEIVAQHWFRDSHGSIRYLAAPKSPSAEVKPAGETRNE
jgi:hypothetical protein